MFVRVKITVNSLKPNTVSDIEKQQLHNSDNNMIYFGLKHLGCRLKTKRTGTFKIRGNNINKLYNTVKYDLNFSKIILSNMAVELSRTHVFKNMNDIA